MKYIKVFEDIKNIPKIGDYVICQDSLARYEVVEFISNNIGQIIAPFHSIPFHPTTPKNPSEPQFVIQYENIPEELKYSFYYENNMKYYSGLRNMALNEIIKFSKNKEELEDYLVAKKYNL